jgi:RimJ/RimL family protein N-acetyltransferase
VWHWHDGADVVLARWVAAAALMVGDWILAKRVQIWILTGGRRCAEDAAQYAWAMAQTGKLRQARRWAQRACRLAPLDGEVRALLGRVEARWAAWRAAHGPAMGLPFKIVPLDLGHAASLVRQFRDPQMAAMSGLPELPDQRAAREWIATSTSMPGRRDFAAIHHRYGLVGYSGLTLEAPDAFFCFWIGLDYQGRGWAPLLARATIAAARDAGVQLLFTAAFEDNHRSRRALERGGFVPVTPLLHSDHDGRCFYVMPLAGADPTAAPARLSTFLATTRQASSLAA